MFQVWIQFETMTKLEQMVMMRLKFLMVNQDPTGMIDVFVFQYYLFIFWTWAMICKTMSVNLIIRTWVGIFLNQFLNIYPLFFSWVEVKSKKQDRKSLPKDGAALESRIKDEQSHNDDGREELEFQFDEDLDMPIGKEKKFTAM